MRAVNHNRLGVKGKGGGKSDRTKGSLWETEIKCYREAASWEAPQQPEPIAD